MQCGKIQCKLQCGKMQCKPKMVKCNAKCNVAKCNLKRNVVKCNVKRNVVKCNLKRNVVTSQPALDGRALWADAKWTKTSSITSQIFQSSIVDVCFCICTSSFCIYAFDWQYLSWLLVIYVGDWLPIFVSTSCINAFGSHQGGRR